MDLSVSIRYKVCLLFIGIAALITCPIALGVGISIVANQGLTFTSIAQGDPATTVDPSSSNASSFTVRGNPNAAFVISFPSGTINMTNGGATLGASAWTSNLASPATLDGTGTAIIYIGATSAAPASNQAPGTYTGTHTVQVQYGGGLGLVRSASANHTITIFSSISLLNTSPLTFGDLAPGDPAKTIAPNGTGAAVFTVSGQANKAYNITLPADGTVTMTTAGGVAPNNQIAVNTFTSSPSGSGSLDGTGNQTLSVGATCAAMSASQVAGNYTASFTVTVTYQ